MRPGSTRRRRGADLAVLACALFPPQDLGALTPAEIAALRPSSTALAAAGRMHNPEAPVPPQCYTRTEGRFNPCYVCHQSYEDPTRTNFMRDRGLQRAYEFSDLGFENRWVNLFVDRSAEVAAISDDEILSWIDDDNYSPLRGALEASGWAGFVPDLEGFAEGAAAFDEHGHARDGSGWVAFRYMPLPSTFWPTNGSTDDVLLRLPEPFRTTAGGAPSADVHRANLGLLELAFTDEARVSIPPVDESAVGGDLDGDGRLDVANQVVRRYAYLGAAADQPLVRMTYPEGTEFLHSVRYVGVDEGGAIGVPRRMKELRYMRKSRALTLPELRSRYGNEQQEKIDGQLPGYVGLGDRGMDTGFGWTMQGFIEDAGGALRPMTDEERFSCRGCHATVGGNLDQTWAFPRKVPGALGWGYPDYRALVDRPHRGGDPGAGEILTYLRRVGGGDEFRSNDEMLARWFDDAGDVREDAVRAASVYDLITPSPGRALTLNKAYRVIVREQSFVFGKDATVVPPVNVYERIDPETAPTLDRAHRYASDIRLGHPGH